MFTLLLSAIFSIRSWLRSRAALQVEILALRHQLTVLKRSQRGRLRLNSADRLLWVGLSRLWSQWRSALLIVKPETVIAWHRRGFRCYWRWKSRQGEPGRPRSMGGSGVDPQDEFGKSALGSAADPWGTAQARYRSIPGHRGQVHGSSATTAFSNLADIPEYPREAVGLDGSSSCRP